MELKIIQTGEWDGEPITRRETVAEAFARELNTCDHQCTSNCRRKGCNCECGEWHEENRELQPEEINELTERD